ncbi:hypothetical protein [Actinomadura sp. 7K507]|uniref:hypothetical protein n=1 Tax=Actinomadura sp. 7K507 TaxID=2530365 RepID=UPI00104BA5FD|nr:hypothetical protein [Actinomadura sp. 7K507]TDC81971.1 hypothetical protein E1285_31550 [Actinomadura sp. 7K507]
MTLQDHMRHAAGEALRSFPDALRPDIYVISLRISHGEYSNVHQLWDYPYDPYMAIGYNTEAHVRQNLEASSSPDPVEFRWNYAYMLLEESGPVGHHPDDPVGTDLYLDEVKSLGLWYEGDLPEDLEDEKSEALCAHFDELCIDTAKHMRSSGLIEKTLGRDVPIVVFDMFRPIEPEATQAANPPHLVPDDYVTFQTT